MIYSCFNHTDINALIINLKSPIYVIPIIVRGIFILIEDLLVLINLWNGLEEISNQLSIDIN
jgi:hypothetical protein